MKKFKFWQFLCYGALIICLVISTLHIFRGDIFYETDISRDMLLLEDMVNSHKISLIGGRSSIPGVFHGPLYYWLALPFFALSGGNPIAVSFLWYIMYLIFLVSFYYVGKKIIDANFALVATTFLASLLAFTPAGFTHTVIAIFLITPIVYFFYLYILKNKFWHLLVAIFGCGLLIQFQMAFGIPTLIILGGYTFYHDIKQKHYLHLLSIFIIFIPLSTFIIFDVRHDFIQLKSLITYLGHGQGGSINGYVADRITSITDSFSVTNWPQKTLRDLISIITIISFGFLSWKIRYIRGKAKIALTLMLMLIFGFWIITAPFKGNVWVQYYRPLLPLVIFCWTYIFMKFIPRKIASIALIILIGINVFYLIRSGYAYWQSTPMADEIHWKFFRQMTHDIYSDAQGKPFGYFVFSPDQYGYQAKYAMHYFSKYQNQAISPYKKLPLTYLIIAPNDHNNPWANEDYWQLNQVKVTSQPIKTLSFDTGYQIRKFILNGTDLTSPADPNLLDGIFFR